MRPRHGRPPTSWALALVAVGIFGGVLTSIIAGGNGDAILRAGARFIDPSAPEGRVLADSAPSRAVTEPMAPPVYPALGARTDAQPRNVLNVPGEDKPIFGEPIDILAGRPKGTEVAPFATKEKEKDKDKDKDVVAKPAPKPRPVVRVARVEPKPEKENVVAEKPERAAKVEKADDRDDDAQKPAKKKTVDLTSAQRADALAKAQLEGSL